MATAFPKVEKIIAVDENLLTCQICKEMFDNPRILPCHHTFCRKCIVILVRGSCLETHESDTFNCPVCRRQLKIENWKKNVNAIMKAIPENKLMNELLEGIDTKKVAFNDFEQERHIDMSMTVQRCLWSHHCFLVLFKKYLDALNRLTVLKGSDEAINNVHINRKLTAMFSEILLLTFENIGDEAFERMSSTSVAASIQHRMTFNDRLREINCIWESIKNSGIRMRHSDSHQMFITEMSKSAWIHPTAEKRQQRYSETQGILLIAYRSLGFSNLFSLMVLIMNVHFEKSRWPMHFGLLRNFNLPWFQMAYIGMVKVLGSIFLIYICDALTGRSIVLSILSANFFAYLILWDFPRNTDRNSMHLQYFDFESGLIIHIPAIESHEFSIIGKIVHSTFFVENICRLLFIIYAFLASTISSTMLPTVWFIVYDVVAKLACLLLLKFDDHLTNLESDIQGPTQANEHSRIIYLS
ncbi:uncharacterized protein LOC128237114 [Mya arenaria]|uniref:uncharacterized protein LOC128237114 n=1 Tax=Mya arenaria TaxID=6604 RepID=UPI0022DFDD78|nr:uncharacterized protein LOC128237114 [Mya arenaria]